MSIKEELEMYKKMYEQNPCDDYRNAIQAREAQLRIDNLQEQEELREAYDFMYKVSKKLPDGSEEASWTASAMDRIATYLQKQK